MDSDRPLAPSRQGRNRHLAALALASYARVSPQVWRERCVGSIPTRRIAGTLGQSIDAHEARPSVGGRATPAAAPPGTQPELGL